MGVARDHLDAVVALLAEHPNITVLADEDAEPSPAGLNVYVGSVPATPPAIYAQLTVVTPRPQTRRLSDQYAVRASRIALMCVGSTQREVLWAVDLGSEALDEKRPISQTRNCSALHGGGAVVREDQDITPSEWIATETWQFVSTPKESA